MPHIQFQGYCACACKCPNIVEEHRSTIKQAATSAQRYRVGDYRCTQCWSYTAPAAASAGSQTRRGSTWWLPETWTRMPLDTNLTARQKRQLAGLICMRQNPCPNGLEDVEVYARAVLGNRLLALPRPFPGVEATDDPVTVFNRAFERRMVRIPKSATF